MDRIIEQKRWGGKRFRTIGGIGLVVLLVCFAYFFTRGNARLNVDAERIVVSELHKGAFKELIPVNGTVLPVSTIYIDIVEGGRVEEKYAEDGAMLTKGQPILKLSNTDLELSLINQETAVFNLLTQMQISRNSAQQNTIAKLNQMAEVDNAFKEAERLYIMNKQLYTEKAISMQEFKQSELAYDYQLKRKKLTSRILTQDSVSTKQELDQAKQSYVRTQDALRLMKQKVGDLVVRSPVDGQLTSLDAEIGQGKNKGDRVGQIDVLSGFKVRAEIDEHYISRIFTGLEGVSMLGNTQYRLLVKKVYTQVKGGRFLVDLQFKDSIPTGIKRGQTLQVNLALSEEIQAVLLPKGGFYQQTAGNWIFKLSADGKKAYKADIQIGRQNPDYYEVLGGLKPGDKVITSSYESYDKILELDLNEK